MVTFELPSEWVSPGLIPLILVLIIAGASIALFLNMRRHLKIARQNDPALGGAGVEPAVQEPGSE